MTYAKRLTREDLFGRTAISYLRWSSAPQEKGSTLSRQIETRDHIIAHYGLVLDHALVDKALSASKGDHRKRGLLADLLGAVAKGVIEPGTVLTVEAIDRLFREGPLDVFPILKDMIRGGLIIVTGDLSIWGEAEINDQGLSHKLLAEINAAAQYARRLSELASGAHAMKRRQMETACDDPTAPLPILNTRPPGWIVRVGRKYVLHPEHVETVQLIFRMCIEGYSCLQIAGILNQQKTPLLGNNGWTDEAWRGPRVGAILRDEKVLGFIQPCVRDGSKRIPTGRKVRIYPAAIDAATWVRADEQLAGRRNALKGRKGSVANLFTHKVFCGTCGAAMRVDTGGHLNKAGLRQRKLLCARYVEARTCEDATRYDLAHFERRILMEIIGLSALVPRDVGAMDQASADELAELQLQIVLLEESIATLAPRVGSSAALADRVERMSLDLDAKRQRADTLVIKRQVAMSSGARRDEVFRFIRKLVVPSMHGDRDARERLRSLLARIDFRVEGSNTPRGAIDVVIGEHRVTIEAT